MSIERTQRFRSRIVRERWTLGFHRGLSGVLLTSARKAHGRRVRDLTKLPPEVKEWAQATGEVLANGAMRLGPEVTWQAVLDCTTNLWCVRNVARNAGRLITVDVPVDHGKVEPCVVVFAEVGESGNGPTEVLWDDPSDAEIEAAERSAIEYAKDLAVETGWADPATVTREATTLRSVG